MALHLYVGVRLPERYERFPIMNASSSMKTSDLKLDVQTKLQLEHPNKELGTYMKSKMRIWNIVFLLAHRQRVQFPKNSNIALILNTEFIYCGRVLEDDQTLGEQGIRTGTTIHVFQKEVPFKPRDMNVTEEHIETATTAYASYFTKNSVIVSIFCLG